MSQSAQLGLLGLRILAIAVFMYLVREQLLFVGIGIVLLLLTGYQMVRVLRLGGQPAQESPRGRP
ncbi:hypothetical protein C1Y63_02925 [Corynebacterium sp. 13CS0277]|uniref:hypothetical protein n=1 Tax=Corynebacterium sp. 13CS0277 TaxID=2071994 RepID=UPI000D022676|nr:hypothetical protein [Corynebacterium sp. 13CS0277]PRQ12044.1 hypothetical protein C1Y63_02925 [Corynebacterium sp. 13CS0277]